jgi:formate hydrogenlyase subunit 3/multisubunit Na+/H+ antiporter MnhD subunit
MLFSLKYFEDVGSLFHGLVLLFLAAMCGFCLTGDLFNMFVFFELMGVAAFALTAYKSEETGPIQGALNFAIVNTLGAIFVLVGLALAYARTGALNMAQVSTTLGGGPIDALLVVSLGLLLVGLLTKAAAAPFHLWLPDAHAVAPTPISVLFSGVMVMLGVFGVVRVYWSVFAPALAGHSHLLSVVLTSPPFATFFGKSVMEEQAGLTGQHWLLGLFVAVSSLTAGAVLRVAGHVFIGLGQAVQSEGGASAGHEKPETEGPRNRTPWSMMLPLGIAVAVAIALGLTPRFSASASAAAERLTSPAMMHQAVLAGQPAPASAGSWHWPSWSSYLIASISAAGAVAVALAGIYLPNRGGRITRVILAPLQFLRRLHSGHVGDYVTWQTLGTAAVLLALLTMVV